MARPKKAPSEKMIQQSLSFKPYVLDVLLEYCQKEERTMSWVVDKALHQYLNIREKQ